jgi:Arylsulfotransferase (ASST)
MFSKSIFAVVSILLSAVGADSQYISRPDLSPPRLNITVPANSTEKGYIFIAPYPAHEGESKGPSQPGAYIFRGNGDLIWSGVGSFGGWVAHFRTGVWKDEPVIFAFQGFFDVPHGRGYGNHAILNSRYETIKISQPSGPLGLLSAHEFHIVNGTNVLIEVPIPVQTDLSPWGGDNGQQWIVSNGFQEINIETGELIFEWRSFDHVQKINPRCRYTIYGSRLMKQIASFLSKSAMSYLDETALMHGTTFISIVSTRTLKESISYPPVTMQQSSRLTIKERLSGSLVASMALHFLLTTMFSSPFNTMPDFYGLLRMEKSRLFRSLTMPHIPKASGSMSFLEQELSNSIIPTTQRLLSKPSQLQMHYRHIPKATRKSCQMEMCL